MQIFETLYSFLNAIVSLAKLKKGSNISTSLYKSVLHKTNQLTHAATGSSDVADILKINSSMTRVVTSSSRSFIKSLQLEKKIIQRKKCVNLKSNKAMAKVQKNNLIFKEIIFTASSYWQTE